MPAHATLTREPEARASHGEKRLDIGVYFKDGKLTRPRYDHILYADTSGNKLGLPRNLEMHPAFLVHNHPRSRIELKIKAGEDSGELAEGFEFQRDSTGTPLLYQGHQSNPIYPPIQGLSYGERETSISKVLVPDYRRCTMTWCDFGRVDRSASYFFFVADKTSLNLRAIPLAIGNLKHRGRMQEQAEAELEAGGKPVAGSRGAGDAIAPGTVKFTIKLTEVAGQIRYSVFKYQNDDYLDIAPDPCFRLYPGQDYLLRFRTSEGLKLKLYNSSTPAIAWYNSVTAQSVSQPEKVDVLNVGANKFDLRIRGSAGRRRAADAQGLPAPRWLTSFFIAGEKDGKTYWGDPTLINPDEEDPG